MIDEENKSHISPDPVYTQHAPDMTTQPPQSGTVVK